MNMPMGILMRYALRTVAFVYLIALLLFVFALQLVELVTNLVQYIQLATPIAVILNVQLLFLPISLHFALPIAMLFSVSFSMGNFHNTREMLAMLGAGVSLARVSVPILAFAALLSLFAFAFEETVVVHARARYNALRTSILLVNAAQSNEFVAVFGGDGNDVYYAEYYDQAASTLVQPTFIERNPQGLITRRVSARSAVWDGGQWILDDAHSYTWDIAAGTVAYAAHGRARLANIEITPESFESAALNIDEMPLRQARNYIVSRRRSGLPFLEELTAYYKRFAFSLTTCVVAAISCGIGAILRRNTLLLSMLLALCVTVLYYVIGLIVDLLAFNGYIAPAFAVWTPLLSLLISGMVLRAVAPA